MEDRPWLKNYAVGIPANINSDAFPNVAVMMEECFKEFADKPAFSNFGKTLNFRDIDKLSEQFGAYLISRGLEKGDRIALMMPNLLQYPIALFGAIRAGLVVVNTNPLYTPREMKHQFTDSGVKAIVIASNFAHNLQKILPETGIKTIILTDLGEMLGFPKRLVVNFVVKHIKKMVPSFQLDNTISFREALSQGKKFKLPELKVSQNDTVLIQYTGGTTGVSKGAMLSHRNLIANMEQIRSIMNTFLDRGKEVALCPLPLYHIFAFTVHCLALMGVGSHSVLVTNPRDLKGLIKEMSQYNLSVMTGVNTLFNSLLNHTDISKVDFSDLKVTIGGGMAIQKPVAERWQKLTGCRLTEGYGLTESSPVLSVNPLDGSGKLGTIGLPVPSTQMRIISDSGDILPPGQEGEIQAKGPQVMKGYYNRPEETMQTVKDGWLSTGDIGVMEEDGFFRIVDRKKDMILVSGFNVYPNEIEEVVVAHEKVLEAAAIGVPDDKSSEAVKLFVVKKDKSLTKDEIIKFCRQELSAYKVPKHVEFRDELPKTNVGKILRRLLRE